jgi:hypothetical protein
MAMVVFECLLGKLTDFAVQYNAVSLDDKTYVLSLVTLSP